MVIIITTKAGGEPVVKHVSKGDWRTMETALQWKKHGIWQKVLDWVHNNNLQPPRQTKKKYYSRLIKW